MKQRRDASLSECTSDETVAADD